MGSSIKSALRLFETFVLCAALASALACSRRQADISATLDLKKAATYLDSREQWWSQWVGSSRDHGTFCISCHTALPYALARPALRAAVGDQDASADERALIDNVTKRVRLWKDTSPYYSEEGYDPKTPESRGTESVLNALILANYDAQRGHLSQDTRTAFDNMWALQRMAGDEKGSWSWLQFDHEPWEAKNSVYYGACLAALAISTAPDDYASSPEIQSKVGMLKNYLRGGNHSQSVINRVFLLWASTKMAGLLSAEEQAVIVNEVLSRQQSDGGWRLAAITWNWRTWSTRSLINIWFREHGSPLRGTSDGVATGLIVYILQKAGVPRENAGLQKGLSWLKSSQTPEGFWPASSINKQEHMSANTKLFMNDAATSFAVLAITESDAMRLESTSARKQGSTSPRAP